MNEEKKRVHVEAGRIVARMIRAGWRLVEERRDGASFRLGIATAIVSVAVEEDGKLWAHASLSLANGRALPSWQMLCDFKEVAFGREVRAIIVIPPRSKHVDIAEVHHVWHCLDGDGLPEFSKVVNGVRTI